MKNRIPQASGKPKTYIIRGQEAMIDRDIAELYGVSMGTFNARVKQHINRFPEDFMFRLTKDEFEHLKRQELALNQLKFSTNPHVFTEGGLLMLSSVLKSKKAIQVSIGVIRTMYNGNNGF